VCGQCGEGNNPSRRFCRRCGNSLAEAVVAARPPWWKRIFTRRKKAPVQAGQRRKGRRGKGRAVAHGAQNAGWAASSALVFLRRGIILLALVGIAVPFVVPNLRHTVTDKAKDAYHSVRRVIAPQYVPVRALDAKARVSAPGHDALMLVDGAKNTWWSGEPRTGKPPTGPDFTLTFEGKVDLAKILVTAGAGDAADVYTGQPRPREIHVVYDTGNSTTATLQDTVGKAQTVNLKGAKQVGRLDFYINSVYASTQGNNPSIAEVELFKKQ
jgi:hypothetical protein